MFSELTGTIIRSSDASWLHLLRCPFCGGALNLAEATPSENKPEYGLLTCHCGRYPLVAGIPVLKKQSGNVEEALRLIETGHYQNALLTMLLPNSPNLAPPWVKRLPPGGLSRWLKHFAHTQKVHQWQKQAASLLQASEKRPTACEVFDFYFQHSRNAYDYFAFRPGQPRHLVALSFINVIPEPRKPILDVACGSGHLIHSLLHRAKSQQVIGIDDWFFGVYVAKHWVAPEANYVCCSADSSLPFADGAVSTVFCSDAFHYFPNKLIPMREFKRLTRDDGLILLVWVRNAHWRCQQDGFPLPPEGYREMVADMPHRLVGDDEVLARYLKKNGPRLATSAGGKELAAQPLISILASHREDVFQDYGPFEEWPHAHGRLALNPLYAMDPENQNGHVHMRRTFPSAHYEQEHQQCKSYLPAEVTLSSQVLDDLRNGRRTPEIAELLDQCVVVGLPERYRVPQIW